MWTCHFIITFLFLPPVPRVTVQEVCHPLGSRIPSLASGADYGFSGGRRDSCQSSGCQFTRLPYAPGSKVLWGAKAAADEGLAHLVIN